MSDILKLNGYVHSDESITNVQYHAYSPYTTAFNNGDEIRIAIQQQDLFTLPCESYIHLEAETVRKVSDNIDPLPTTVNFFATHIFDDIRYEINGFEIDRCKNPGVTATLKGLISLSAQDQAAYYLATLGQTYTGTGVFECFIPLKMLFGFAEDYRKIIMNAKHELILTRSRNDVNCFVGAHDNVKFNITKIQWKMQHVQVSDQSKLTLLKHIDRNISTAFRSWEIYEYPALPTSNKHLWSIKTSTHLNRPRYLIVGFQTNRKNRIAGDCSTFDHINLTDIKVHLNSESYPYENMNLAFGSNKYVQAYQNFFMFQKTYYHGNSNSRATNITYADFKDKFPLFVIDCSRQNDVIKSSMVDIRLEMTASAAFPANTTAYCLIINDNIVNYNPYTNMVTRTV